MENRNYTILIKAEDVKKESAISGQSSGGETSDAKETASKGQLKGLAVGLTAAKKIKGYVNTIVNHEVSMVGLRTGSNEMQERASFINQAVNKGVDMLMTIGVGAATGGVVGALIGVGIGVVETAVGYAFAQDRLNTERTIENETIRRNYVRAGAKGSR